MARPRRVDARHCIICRRRTYADAEDRAGVALHRLEHARADRRRAQWRAYKQRKQQRPDVVGWLHYLGCNGGHRGTRGKCQAIPLYAHHLR